MANKGYYTAIEHSGIPFQYKMNVITAIFGFAILQQQRPAALTETSIFIFHGVFYANLCFQR